jgi:hypothetical protein
MLFIYNHHCKNKVININKLEFHIYMWYAIFKTNVVSNFSTIFYLSYVLGKFSKFSKFPFSWNYQRQCGVQFSLNQFMGNFPFYLFVLEFLKFSQSYNLCFLTNFISNVVVQFFTKPMCGKSSIFKICLGMFLIFSIFLFNIFYNFQR